MDPPSVLGVFRKQPASLAFCTDVPGSLISATWCNRHGFNASEAGYVNGFLAVGTSSGTRFLHLSLRPTNDLHVDLLLDGVDTERCKALSPSFKMPGKLALHSYGQISRRLQRILADPVSSTVSASARGKERLTNSPITLPLSSCPMSFCCPSSRRLLYAISHFIEQCLRSRAEFLTALDSTPQWFHLPDNVVTSALNVFTRTLLVTRLNQMQRLMSLPLTSPSKKSEAINTIVSVYQSFVQWCLLSDPQDVVNLVDIDIRVVHTPARFFHSLLSAFFGPGLCQSLLCLYRAEFTRKVSVSQSSDHFLVDSLKSVSLLTLRQLMSKADCPKSSRYPEELAMYLTQSFLTDVAALKTMHRNPLAHFITSLMREASVSELLSADDSTLFDLFLTARYGSYLVHCYHMNSVVFPDLIAPPKELHRCEDSVPWATTAAEVEKNWPSLPSREIIHDCMTRYRNALIVKPACICCVCSRRSQRIVVHAYSLQSDSVLSRRLVLLRITDPHLKEYFDSKPHTTAYVQVLHGALLDTRGIHRRGESEILQICEDCAASLLNGKLPRYALANNLYLGELPSEFFDVTWAEEQICALFRLHVYVVRLFASDDANRKLFGNTCAFPQNVLSTAAALPRTPADVMGNITVVFIGSRKPSAEELLKYRHYTVRRGLVWRLLLYFYEYHHFYQGLPPPRPELVSAYPEYGLLPGFEDRIIWDQESDAHAVFAQETAGMSVHPATEYANATSETDQDPYYLESTGVVDPNLHSIPARHLEHVAVSNLAKTCDPEDVLTTAIKPTGTQPDLLISRGAQPITDYNNPALFPGLFPTLFPLGIGGFEDPLRPVKLQFLPQAEYFLDLATRCFRHHQTYIFAALNIHQRREVNLRTYLTISRQSFQRVAPRLNNISSHTLDQLATRIEQESLGSHLSDKENEAMTLLRHVNTIAAKIPGSEAMKAAQRGNIRAYFQFFGLAHLFMTINPSPIHSPVFQFMVGDYTIDLRQQYPILPSRQERALRVAQDPVEAADFYQWSLDIIFEYLFGWDKHCQRSRREGGILGHLQAHYVISELTERGFFHAHNLLWLLGAPNPEELHTRLNSADFQRRFFEFYEAIIFNHFPDVDVTMPSSYNCSQELPPFPPPFADIADPESPAALRWQSILDYETKICATDCQLHSCRPVCHKYKNDGVCRFNFPLEVVSTSSYDPDRKAVSLRVLNPWVNYYNPVMMVFCRHNHDIKCILSGRACRAGMIYITNYITKMDFKTQHALSLLSKAVAATQGTEGSPVRQAQVLLQKCVTQFNRRQQIHAQQACRYLRGFTDSVSSHRTVLLLSRLLLSVIYDLYPALKEDDKSEEVYVPLERNEDGVFKETSQVEDYFYRGDRIRHLNFYDFVRLVECVKKSKEESTPIAYEADVSNFCVELKAGHQLTRTHHLRVRSESTTPFSGDVQVPLMVGAFPPRPSSSRYCVFVAAHFIPFGKDLPLPQTPEQLKETVECFPFNSIAKRVMKNWEAFHECEDERDAERLRKRERAAAVGMSQVHTAEQTNKEYEETILMNMSSLSGRASRLEQLGQELVGTFHLANWFETHENPTPNLLSSTCETKQYDLVVSNIKQWLASLNQADKAAKLARRSGSKVPSITVVTETVNATQIGSATLSKRKTAVSRTLVTHENLGQDAQTIESRLIEKSRLNEKQVVAFKIIASQFLDRFHHKKQTSEPPLRLLLTGPGGTGKTHVIKSLKKLMKHYGLGHSIRLLAPTGATASMISGMTIHSGLKIGFQTSRIEGEDSIVIQFTTSVNNRRLLREEFKDAKVMFMDEMSLVPQELLAEVDAALREAMEVDEWMGGIMVIYSGDFMQHSPVGGDRVPKWLPYTNFTISSAEFELQVNKSRYKDQVVC